jgi:hypothetical protein
MADVVWDEVLHTDYEVAGSASVLLQAAGSAADPWLTALPGAYGAGSAGYIIGGFSASSDPWNVDLPGAYSGTKAGKILADILADTATIDTAGEIAAAVWSADATTYQTQGTFGQAIGDPAADANSIYKAVVTDAGLATVGLDVVEVLTRVPNATAGEAGGLVVCGPNATLTITDVTTAGSVGKYLKDILDDTAILPGTWVVPGPGTSTLTTTDVDNRLAAWGKTGFALSATGADLIAKTSTFAGAIADAVWDEAQSGHTGAGSFGLYVDGKISEAGGGGLTAAAVADAVWDEVATGHVDAGKAGAQLWTVINTLSSGAAINITTTTTIIESE